ncbi:MAG: glycosyltransferase [bacterium]
MRVNDSGEEQCRLPTSGTLWVVIPARQEADNLARLIPRLLACLPGGRARILIVEDGPDPATDAVLARLGEGRVAITLYRRHGRRGLGRALSDGLARALEDPACSHIVTLDADLSHDPEHLPALLGAAEQAAFVQGSRYVRGSRILDGSLPRRLASRAANRLTRLLGSTLAEHTTNFRVYDRRAAGEAITCGAAGGFEWIVASSLAIQSAGLRSIEVPITFRPRGAGRSKLGLRPLLHYAAFFLRRVLLHLYRQSPAGEPWFRWGLAAHLGALLLLAHVYDAAVFQDASARLIRGEGVYAPFARWFSEHGDGYYAYPPVYAYMLWASGVLAKVLGGHWWIHQVLIKGWMFLADLAVVAVLWRASPRAARGYWTLWFVPVLAIAQVQPDIWVGGAVLLAFLFATGGRWTAAGLALAVGIGLKGIPLVILPFLLMHLGRQRRWGAAGRVTAAAALGGLLLWLPYLAFYDDARQFGQALAFHLQRPALGLNLAGGIRALTDAAAVVDALAGPGLLAAGAASAIDQRVASLYPALTALAFAILFAAAWIRRWSLAQVFVLPLLAFLLTARVVNEQYLLAVLPLLLLTAPAILPPLLWPYSVYVLAAGTPLRFFPAAYGLPLSPLDLLPDAVRAQAGPLIGLALSAALAGAALLFTYRLWRLVHASLTGGQPRAEVALPPYPEAVR